MHEFHLLYSRAFKQGQVKYLIRYKLGVGLIMRMKN